jgi:hypothetical protein
MSSITAALRQRLQFGNRQQVQPPASPVKEESSPSVEKQVSDEELPHSIIQQDGAIPKDAEAGEQTLDENAAGGLGRHLGVFSTTFLV